MFQTKKTIIKYDKLKKKIVILVLKEKTIFILNLEQSIYHVYDTHKILVSHNISILTFDQYVNLLNLNSTHIIIIITTVEIL